MKKYHIYVTLYDWWLEEAHKIKKYLHKFDPSIDVDNEWEDATEFNLFLDEEEMKDFNCNYLISLLSVKDIFCIDVENKP